VKQTLCTMDVTREPPERQQICGPRDRLDWGLTAEAVAAVVPDKHTTLVRDNETERCGGIDPGVKSCSAPSRMRQLHIRNPRCPQLFVGRASQVEVACACVWLHSANQMRFGVSLQPTCMQPDDMSHRTWLQAIIKLIAGLGDSLI
jgi:hypothetical protein